MSTIVYKINKLLEDKKVSKTDFAKAIGVNRDTVYNFTDDSIKVSLLLKISDFLGVSVDYFFSKEEKKEAKTKISIVAEESEVYGVTNYKEKYFETLEKLNACNERVLAFTDLKKNVTKKP